MTTDPSQFTIGVFDSGFGGLTVLRALVTRLPQARFVFLGDTARLPYGSKSRRTIARYAAESAQFLTREQGAEFLVIACNTASALALDAIQQAASPVPVLGVIEPGAAAASAASTSRNALVIATDATVRSGAYTSACSRQGLRAHEMACPLLVPLVEEGWIDHPVTAEVVRIYLADILDAARQAGLNPDTLLLGCTHYPLLRPLIEKTLSRIGAGNILVIDSAEATAEAAARQLLGPPVAANAQTAIAAPASAVHRPSPVSTPAIRCFATDSVEKFERLGSRFLGESVGKVELVDLGG